MIVRLWHVWHLVGNKMKAKDRLYRYLVMAEDTASAVSLAKVEWLLDKEKGPGDTSLEWTTEEAISPAVGPIGMTLVPKKRPTL